MPPPGSTKAAPEPAKKGPIPPRASTQKICTLHNAMQFDLEERARLAGALLLGMDQPSESEIERLAHEANPVKGVPATKV